MLRSGSTPLVLLASATACWATACADPGASETVRGSDASTLAEGADACTEASQIADDAGAPSAWVVAGPCVCGPGDWSTVDWVADGDTLSLSTGERIRFLGVDTPETSSGDCESGQAKAFTEKNAGKGTAVCLTGDSKAGDKDIYGRLLRYVWLQRDHGVVLLNARLVRVGLARVYYPFASGLRLEAELNQAQKAARTETAGGWGLCGW